jgi:Bacterial PH domain
MRLSVPDVEFPVAHNVGRYLLPREKMFVTVRQHPALLLPPLASAVGVLLTAIAVSGIPHVAQSVRIAIWILTFAFAVRFAVTLFDWFIRLIVVTDQRFMLIAGLATTTVQTISFPNLADMTFQRAPAGRIFGFGTFTIESAGNTHAVINYVPYPEQIYLEIFGALFPGSAVLPDPAEAAATRPGPAEVAPSPPGPASAGLGWPGAAAGPEADGPAGDATPPPSR